MRLDGIEYETWHRSTEDIPLWLKNELKYLDVDLNFHREVALKIQRFRIAEDEFNGADEDEPWWKPGRNCEIEPPSQRLSQRASLDQGWPEEVLTAGRFFTIGHAIFVIILIVPL